MIWRACAQNKILEFMEIWQPIKLSNNFLMASMLCVQDWKFILYATFVNQLMYVQCVLDGIEGKKSYMYLVFVSV
jgi:hypothetical protein